MARFDDIEDVDFTGGITIAELKETARQEYINAYKDLTGETIASIPDKIKAELDAAVQIIYQQTMAIGEKAKQNLLKYARGPYLENLALRFGVTRKRAEKAITKIKFTLSAPRESVVAIPKGTRVTSAARNIYFETQDYTEIPIGETTVDIESVSTTGGAEANNFSIGELSVLVDPIAYVATVSNTEIPTGGGDEESDELLAERVFSGRYTYSTTGAEEAYIHYIKSYSSKIVDVKAKNPSDAEIVFYILLDSGETAADGFINELKDYICDPTIKALTDHIEIRYAESKDYAISISYGISEDDTSRSTEIQSAVTAAVDDYIEWQKKKIGRDIDPQELLVRCKNAGAKNVIITQPEQTAVDDTQTAHCISQSITYSGIIYN